MEDELKNIRYLIGKGTNRKLKRNVPKRLLDVAGVTAWTDRKLSGLSNSEIKEKASLFAVYTDTQIRVLDRELRSSIAETKVQCAATFDLQLGETEARQLAIWYYWREDELRRKGLPYKVDNDGPDYEDVLLDAGTDVSNAERNQNEISTHYNYAALEILFAAGLITSNPTKRSERKKWFERLRDHQGYLLLVDLVERAELELVNQRLHSLTDAKHTYLADSFFVNSISPESASIVVRPMGKSSKVRKPLKTVTDAFLAYQKKQVGISRFDQYKVPVRALLEFLGADRDVRDIRKSDLFPVRDFLPDVPAYVTRHFPNMTLQEAAKVYQKRHGEKANRFTEAVKSLSAIGQIFRYAFGEDWIEIDPTSGLKLAIPIQFRPKNYQKKSDGYAPYSTSELSKIFSSNVYSAEMGRSHFQQHGYKKTKAGVIVRDQMYWAPLVAVWTGARMNEILQLERGDLKREGAIWFINVTDEEEIEYVGDSFTKRVKNSNAVRDIPLHNFLIDIGFVTWARKTKNGRLFPNAHRGKADKPSSLFSKNYHELGKKLGVWEYRKKVFHSFRNNFNDELRHSSVAMEMRVAVNGWEEQQKMDALYGRGHKVLMLYDNAIGKVRYEKVDWSVVRASADGLP